MANYDDTATVSGSVVSFSDGADEVGLKSCVVSLSASLSGYSEVNAKQAKKNLLNPSYFSNMPTAYTVNQDGSITVIASENSAWTTLPTMFLKAGTYTLSRQLTGSVCYIRTSLDDYASNALAIYNARTEASFTLAEDAYIKVKLGTNGTYPFTDNYQLEVGSSSSAFEKYVAPTQYTANLGRTIHYGTADIVKGEGMDYGLWVDMSTISWTEDPNRLGVFYGTVTGRKTATASDPSDVIVCTCYDVNNINVTTNIDKYISGARSYGGNIIFFRDSSMAGYTRAQVQEALSGEKVCVVSANPTAFTFDPVSVETSKGSNTFWSDQGNTELTYYKDGYGFTSVTVTRQAPDQADDVKTAYLHKVIFGGLVDVIQGKAEPKNLIPFNVDYKGYSATTNGMTMVVLDDGRIKFNGTTSANTDFSFYNVNIPSGKRFFVPNGTYTVSSIGNTNFKMIISGGGNNGFQYREITNGSFTSTVTDDTKPFNYIIFRFTSGITLDNLIVSVQLESGSSASEFAPHFEPFTFPPISMETDEGENTLFADEGDSAIIYRKAVD